MGKKLTFFEKTIIESIIKSIDESDYKYNLVKQYENMEVQERTYTTTGFFVDVYIKANSFSIGEDIQMELGSIYAEIKGLKMGAGFILFIRNGLIKMLEGYCYDELWPKNTKINRIYKVKKDGSLMLLGCQGDGSVDNLPIEVIH